MAEKSNQFRLAAEPDFYAREDGYPGLISTYGFDFKEKIEINVGLKYQTIDTNEADVINIFSTDGKLQEYNLVVLEDDKNFFHNNLPLGRSNPFI